VSVTRRRRLLVSLLLVPLFGCGGGGRRAPAPDGGAAPASLPAERTQTLFGGERGMDHVGVAVPDLEAAARTYQEKLGFSKPQTGRLPNGIRNVNFYFADATYLEILTHYDRGKATWLADFTDQHSGALFLVLAAYSPEATAAFLAPRGLRISKPVSGTIQTAADRAMPEEKWKTFAYERSPLPGDPLYFIAYGRPGREAYLEKLKDRRVRRVLYHDNTALGLHAVWLAVPDLEPATRAFTAAGFTAGRRFDDPRLHAKGQVIEAGQGAIYLLASATPDGAIAQFLRRRGGPGLAGLTIEAGSADAAARLIGGKTGRTFATYAGLLGPSVLIPPELTHGVWLEFAEKPAR
jgi:catechol 2,3-dioxygenase-like lactoylglutathione lyase family enzyme